MRRDANARARLMRFGWIGLIFDIVFGAKENLEDICTNSVGLWKD